jgi:hypothetical protein
MNGLLFLGLFLVSSTPLYAQGDAQGAQPDVAKLKADAQKVVSIISRDKAKTQTYCQIADLGEQMDQAGQEKDNKKIEELAQKLPELEKNLGPEYIGLVDSLRNVDLTSKDRDDIVSIFDELDEACPD